MSFLAAVRVGASISEVRKAPWSSGPKDMAVSENLYSTPTSSFFRSVCQCVRPYQDALERLTVWVASVRPVFARLVTDPSFSSLSCSLVRFSKLPFAFFFLKRTGVWDSSMREEEMKLLCNESFCFLCQDGRAQCALEERRIGLWPSRLLSHILELPSDFDLERLCDFYSPVERN